MLRAYAMFSVKIPSEMRQKYFQHSFSSIAIRSHTLIYA
nr:MAG TPA: hypothetical protein [Caudoviricetes sp.]